MDEKMLEQEYKKLKQQAAPDLWNRIEQNLAEHPERENSAVRVAEAEKPEEARKPIEAQKPEEAQKPAEVQKPVAARRILRWRSAYGMAAAAAVVVVVVFANRQVGSKSTAMPEHAAAFDAETTAMVMAEVEAAEEAVEAAAGGADGGTSANPAGSPADKNILSYEDLQLAACQPLAVPEQAVTVPEDTAYFSEAILGDTGLLCKGTVTEVSLEQGADGRAVKVVYEVKVEQVCYAEDYTTGMERITVKSPIVETEGDEAYILYQLRQDGTYLLPLEKRDGGWELLYPFAPQIQVTGDGAYLFHSGYASLVSSDTSVVIGSQEGDSDYYYDRMLLRNDDNFLSDLISLVEREAQGRK